MVERSQFYYEALARAVHSRPPYPLAMSKRGKPACLVFSGADVDWYLAQGYKVTSEHDNLILALRAEADTERDRREQQARAAAALAQKVAEQKHLVAERKQQRRQRAAAPAWTKEQSEDRVVKAYRLRLAGETYAEIGRQCPGIRGPVCRESARGLVNQGRRVNDRRLRLFRAQPKARVNASEAGDARDVWLTFSPGPDPRFDFMEPVTAEAAA